LICWVELLYLFSSGEYLKNPIPQLEIFVGWLELGKVKEGKEARVLECLVPHLNELGYPLTKSNFKKRKKKKEI
jgi:hypothetical protein